MNIQPVVASKCNIIRLQPDQPILDLCEPQVFSVVTVTETGTETAVSTRNRTEPKPRFFAA